MVLSIIQLGDSFQIVCSTSFQRFGDRNSLNFYEERDRRESMWIVRTTHKLVGDAAIPTGTLDKKMVIEAVMVMKAWARRSARPNCSNSTHVVEQLLHRLLMEQDAGNPHVEINTDLYNVVIESWSKSRQPGSAQRAEDILVTMERIFQMGNHDIRPNRFSFNCVIKAWVVSKNKDTIYKKIEPIIQRMEQFSESDPYVLPPSRRSYNLLLYAYAHSTLDDAGERAEAILDKMVEEGPDDKFRAPDANSYNLVIKAYGLRGKKGREFKGQAIFDRILADPDLKPNVETFNAILQCWLKSKDKGALQRMIEIVELMEESYRIGNLSAKPDSFTVNSVVTALVRNTAPNQNMEKALEFQNRMEAEYEVQSDTVSFNIILDGLAKTKRKEAPIRALEILTRMEDEYKAGKIHIMPDQFSYTIVIDSFTKCDRLKAGKKASAVLDQMKELYAEYNGPVPTVEVYNAVLNAWASQRSKGGAKMALSILEEMEQNHKHDTANPKPDRMCYNTVLKSLRTGEESHATRAVELLEQMNEFAKDNPKMAPDAYTYASVMNALGRSNIVDKAERTFKVLLQMIESYKGGNSEAKPNIIVFNCALNACAFSRYDMYAKANAFVVAISVLVLLRQYTHADEVTCSTIMRACSNLLSTSDPRRDRLAEIAFNKACKEGYVSEGVLSQLYFAASDAMYESLMKCKKGESVSLATLPAAWTANRNKKACVPRNSKK